MRVVPFDAGYTLTAAEQQRIKMAGNAIYRLNRAANSAYKWFHHTGVYSNEHDSLGAKLAFTKLAGVELLNMVLHEWAGINTDCELPDLGECNVLHTRLARPTLFKEEKTPHFTHSFALMIGRFPTFHFRGWTVFEEFIRPGNLEWRNGTQKYAMGECRLHHDLVIPQ